MNKKDEALQAALLALEFSSSYLAGLAGVVGTSTKAKPGHISYVGSGNKVGKTDGARPVMDLPTEFPDDINYDWYINEAVEMLYDCGRLKKAKTAALSFF